ncbi:hypothetical protein [Flavobacterium sp.]
MKKIVCRYDFHKSNSTELDTFSGEVRNGVYTNPTVFTVPPVTESDFIVFQQTFSATAAEYAQYGFTKKVAFDNARFALVNTLDSIADFVNKIAYGNASTIALSGFVPTSDTTTASVPLGKIDSFEVKLTKSSGEITVSIPAYSNQPNVAYGCICIANVPLTNLSIINGQFRFTADDKGIIIDLNRSRQKTFYALVPGIKYYFYAYATNSAGVSPLSNAQSIYVS